MKSVQACDSENHTTVLLYPIANKRRIFDQYGEEGLKRGGGDGGASSFEGYSFTGDPREMFSQFFGNSNPFDIFENGGQGRSSFTFSQDGGSMDFSNFMGGLRGSFSGVSMGGMQDSPVEHPLNLHLEELYNGCTKKMKISRRVVGGNGTQEKIVAVEVKPGWKAGTRVVFAREGDQLPGKIPSDVVFVIGEKPHGSFTREGNDLRHKASISLRAALCGGDVDVPFIEGEVFRYPLKGVVTSSTEDRISGRGMPISKQPGCRGDLLINYDIKFPTSISESDRKHLNSILKKYEK